MNLTQLRNISKNVKKRGKFEIKKIHPKHRRYIKEWIGVEKKKSKKI